MDKNYRKALINSFVDQSFRDEADRDYIAARINYQLGFMQQFLWLALQAIEKYLKAILIYNNKNAQTGHSLKKAMDSVKSIEYIQFEISDDMEKFIKDYLDEYGNNRYLSYPTFTRGAELLWLDKAVWEIRRYCQDFDAWSTPGPKGRIHLRASMLKTIKSEYYKKNPHKFILSGGYLERVLQDKANKIRRKSLVWKNFFYGQRKKNKLKHFQYKGSSAIPAHFRYPEIYMDLKDIVYFPNSVNSYFRGKGPIKKRVAGRVCIKNTK